MDMQNFYNPYILVNTKTKIHLMKMKGQNGVSFTKFVNTFPNKQFSYLLSLDPLYLKNECFAQYVRVKIFNL